VLRSPSPTTTRRCAAKQPLAHHHHLPQPSQPSVVHRHDRDHGRYRHRPARAGSLRRRVVTAARNSHHRRRLRVAWPPRVPQRPSAHAQLRQRHGRLPAEPLLGSHVPGSTSPTAALPRSNAAPCWRCGLPLPCPQPTAHRRRRSIPATDLVPACYSSAPGSAPSRAPPSALAAPIGLSVQTPAPQQSAWSRSS
jgi:hypothetical protein